MKVSAISAADPNAISTSIHHGIDMRRLPVATESGRTVASRRQEQLMLTVRTTYSCPCLQPLPVRRMKTIFIRSYSVAAW
jgi:hypothetical protein